MRSPHDEQVMIYGHQQPEWPSFRYDDAAIASPLAATRHRQGLLLGRMESVGFQRQRESLLEVLVDDVQKSSLIEGDQLDRTMVRSSIARRLGIEVAGVRAVDRSVEGVVEMMLDATQGFDKPLTQDRLIGWQASLFPIGFSGLTKIVVGRWRDDSTGPMQVVSGTAGRERVHFQAPDASRVSGEMTTFLKWFNAFSEVDGVLRAAIAHLWFITIHPFDDGNGRIARAIADMALARSEGSSQRFYSISAQICRDREAYYNALEKTQRGLDVTEWILWFLTTMDQAIAASEETLAHVRSKAAFWASHDQSDVNPRQRLVLDRMLDGLEGKMKSSKWAKMAKCSQDTALRDILDLVAKGLLSQDDAGGRSTTYSLPEL